MEGRLEQTIDLRQATPGSRRHVDVLWIDPERFTEMLAPPKPSPGGAWWLIARCGIASLLAVNAIYAFVSPEDFENVVADNPVGEQIDRTVLRLAVLGAGVNDALLAAAVMSRTWRTWVWSWLGTWFAIIAATKVLNLVT